MAALLERGSASLSELLASRNRALRVDEVEVRALDGSLASLMNLNVPEGYARALRMFEGSTP